jgi:hypothetical protein
MLAAGLFLTGVGLGFFTIPAFLYFA